MYVYVYVCVCEIESLSKLKIEKRCACIVNNIHDDAIRWNESMELKTKKKPKPI